MTGQSVPLVKSCHFHFPHIPASWSRRLPLVLLYSAFIIFHIKTVWAIRDDDAAQRNIDTIYTGTITATLTHEAEVTPKHCLPNLLRYGPYSSSRLTIGPNHNLVADPNMFYLALVGGDKKGSQFLTAVQSSVTSNQTNQSWWAVQAWEHSTGSKGRYEVTGTMIKDPGAGMGRERNQLSMVWKVGMMEERRKEGEGKIEKIPNDKRDGSEKEKDDDDDEQEEGCKKGDAHTLNWKFTRNSSIKAVINKKSASMIVTGKVTLEITKDKEKKRAKRALGRRQEGDNDDSRIEVTYTINFAGTHYSGSAPLPVDGLSWKEPGPGPPLPPYEFFEVKADAGGPNTSSPTISHSSTSSMSTPTVTTHTPTSTQTKHPQPDGTAEPGWGDSGLPKGSVVGIVVGGVIALVIFAVMWWLIRRWFIKRKEPKVYPELAYIYSTPYTTTKKSAQTQMRTDESSSAAALISGALGAGAGGAAGSGGLVGRGAGTAGGAGGVTTRGIDPDPSDDDDDSSDDDAEQERAAREPMLPGPTYAPYDSPRPTTSSHLPPTPEEPSSYRY